MSCMVTNHSLLTTHHSPSRLATHHLRLTAHYVLLATHASRLTTQVFCSLLIPHSSPPASLTLRSHSLTLATGVGDQGVGYYYFSEESLTFTLTVERGSGARYGP